MNSRILFVFGLITIYVSTTRASVGGYIGPDDRKKLLSVLVKSLAAEKGDFTSAYYGTKGFNLLKEPLVEVLINNNCHQVFNNYQTKSSAEDKFYAISAWKYLGCKGSIHTKITVLDLGKVLDSDKSPVSELRFAAEALTRLGLKIEDTAKVAKAIQAKLKEDDSLQSLGHALHAAALLGPDGNFILDRIEDIVVQADEVDGKLLQWEGGLTTTSLIITGLLRFPQAKPLTALQAEKLAAYLLTRRTVQTPKGALALVEAATSLAESDVSPVSISVAGAAQVTVDKPELAIHISDILGNALKTPPTPVVAQSATRITDDVVVLSKQPLAPGSSPVEFTLPLRLEPGQYRIALSAGTHSTTVTARVLGPVKLESFQIGLSDSDGSAAPRLTTLQPPAKLPTVLRADSGHALIAKFALSRPVHQAFLRLYSGNKEIVFVAEIENAKLYKVDVDLANELKQSGTFQIELILGDSVMSNPLRWELGTIEVSLNVPETARKISRGPKPEIKHLFRPAEKRPPEIVSLLFTGLTLSPLLLLLVLWLRIGINFGNFTPIALPFHLGFASILGLFLLFWWKLDMFTTCAWLLPVGTFTFLAAQTVLSQIAKQRKA